jgi:voltage-gated potassium channel Kch
MVMIAQLLEGVILVALTVAIHGVVLGWCFRKLGLDEGARKRSFVLDTWLLSRLAILAVLAHLVEICLWGLFYYWRGIMPDAEISFYFSAVTYATIGYGDVVPPENWRLLASMEGLTGILMCAWSGGFFFATVARLYALQPSDR